MLWLLAAPAVQAAYITEISDPIVLQDRAGTWVRTFNDDGDWWFFIGAGGGRVAPTGPEFDFLEDDLIWLTRRNELQDHGVTRCPDGGFLHVASYSQGQHNDSAHAYRYDSQWQLLGDSVVEEGVSSVSHNDMTVVCSPDFQGVIFAQGNQGRWFSVGSDGAVSGPQTLSNVPVVTGGSAVEVEGELWVFGMDDYNSDRVRVARYAQDFSALGSAGEVTLSPDGGTPYWTQGLLKVGELFLLAHMGRAPGQSFNADTGNVYLSVLDADLTLLQQVRISDFEGGEGAMRPGLMRDGETVVVSYDAELRPNMVFVTLDLSGQGSLDTGWGDSDSSDDTGDTGGGGLSGGCGGCAGGGGLAGLWGIAALAGLLRRRR